METPHYRLMQESDIPAVIKCLSTAFTKSEPMTSFLKIDEVDFAKFAAQVCDHIINDQLSIIAETDSANIIGVRLCGTYSRNPKPLVIPEPMQAIVALLDHLHEIPMPLFTEKSIHLKMLGIDARFRNQGIAQTLLLETFKNAKMKGYDHALVEATSSTTQHIFINKFQFRLLNKICYQTFTYHHQLIFKHLPNETHCTLLGKQL